MNKPQRLSFLIMAVLLLAAGWLRMSTLLLTALFCYFALRQLSFKKSKLLGVSLFAVLVLGSFVTIAVFAVVGLTPLSTLFSVFLLPYAGVPIRIIYARDDGPSLIRALKSTARLHLWVGVSLAAAVALLP